MKFIKIVKFIYRKNFFDFTYHLKKELSSCNSVLDLGCGHNSLIRYCDIPFKIGVELFEPYVEESKKKGIHNQYIKGDITEVDFEPKSFDAVVAIDVLEHLLKEEGHDLIKKMEKWARKKIVILTPNGYIHNDIVNGNSLQEHKSGWSAEEFRKLGFKVFGINGWEKLRGEEALIKYKPVILWIIISDITQKKIVYHYPELAFHLLAVKEINFNNFKLK